ncbi:FAD-dependent monooxygenase [Pseudonocardia eucalypti]|uniref:FAD-dependent monooxygenase n=1 Tax=Pseudonocardia eucalypti TaxID=648755 RepID=A0ABP9QJX9_9PSEU|nr:salicylate hydroxylase [Pseudonocardia eucalypti]
MTSGREAPVRSGEPDEPLAIIGGGVGGLTAALALQRFGFRVTVFEQAHQLREIGAGVTITPNAMHALDFLGVGPRVVDASGPAPRYAVCDTDGRILELGPPTEEILPAFGAAYVNARRADLHAALVDAILARDPDCVRLNHRFEHLEQDAEGVDLRFGNGERIRAGAVIGCDGGASRVRSVVFGREEVAYTGQTAFRALVPASAVPAEIIATPYRLYVGRGRTLIHYEVRRGELMNLLGIVLEPNWQAEGWSIPAEPAEFLDQFADFPAPVRKLIHAVPPGSLYKWGLRDRDPLDTWTSGRVATLGDAAHPFLPFLGQGACIAIEDGLVLGRALAATPDLEQGFARYEAARKQRANGLQLASREQARHHQGVAGDRPGPGNTAAARGLFSYNPATVPI